MLQRYILLWLVASSGLAFVWPDLLQWVSPHGSAEPRHTGFLTNPFIWCRPGIRLMIAITMFCVGSLLPIAEVNNVFRKWPAVLTGTAIQYGTMPLLAWLVVQLVQPSPELAAGILIVGCVPGAMASNVLTLTARGNVSYSVSLTTAATLVSPVAVPLLLKLMSGDSASGFDGQRTIRLLLICVVLPTISGHILRRFAPRFRRLADLSASVIANLAILLIIAVVVAGSRSQLQQSGWALIGPLALINIAGYAAGYFGAKAAGFPEGMRRALTLEVGMQNAGAGVGLAMALFGETSPATVPCAIYTFGCMLTGTILATAWQISAQRSAQRPRAEETGTA